MALVSCAKFHYIPHCNEFNIRLIVTNNCVENIDADYSELAYEWDEEKYGKILSYNSDALSCVVLDGLFEKKEDVEVIRDIEKRLELDYPNTYNLILHNKTEKTIYSTGIRKYIAEAGYVGFDSDFGYSEPHGVINQSEELCKSFEEDVFSIITEKELTLNDMELLEDGTYVYDCVISHDMIPVSFVYFVQVIIYDDDKEIPMLVSNCNYMGICGVAESVDLVSGDNGYDCGVIETFDVKPFQNNENYSVCCAKFTTYGLPKLINESSWNEERNCEVGIEFQLLTGKIKRGKVSVAKKMEEIPHGGVITIILNNSEIYNSSDFINDGINPQVNDWDEVIIDIPF